MCSWLFRRLSASSRDFPAPSLPSRLPSLPTFCPPLPEHPPFLWESLLILQRSAPTPCLPGASQTPTPGPCASGTPMWRSRHLSEHSCVGEGRGCLWLLTDGAPPHSKLSSQSADERTIRICERLGGERAKPGPPLRT